MDDSHEIKQESTIHQIRDCIFFDDKEADKTICETLYKIYPGIKTVGVAVNDYPLYGQKPIPQESFLLDLFDINHDPQNEVTPYNITEPKERILENINFRDHLTTVCKNRPHIAHAAMKSPFKDLLPPEEQENSEQNKQLPRWRRVISAVSYGLFGTVRMPLHNIKDILLMPVILLARFGVFSYTFFTSSQFTPWSIMSYRTKVLCCVTVAPVILLAAASILAGCLYGIALSLYNLMTSTLRLCAAPFYGCARGIFHGIRGRDFQSLRLQLGTSCGKRYGPNPIQDTLWGDDYYNWNLLNPAQWSSVADVARYLEHIIKAASQKRVGDAVERAAEKNSQQNIFSSPTRKKLRHNPEFFKQTQKQHEEHKPEALEKSASQLRNT